MNDRLALASFTACCAALFLFLSAGVADAQYNYRCTQQSQCPVGTWCANGVCVQNQPSRTAPVAPVGQPVSPGGVGARPASAPATVRTEERVNLGLTIAGAAMLGASYISNIVVSLFAGIGFGSSAEEAWNDFRFVGLVPVLGPWIQLGIKPTPIDQDYWVTWLVIDGVLQAAGLTMLIVGLTVRESVEVRAVAEIGDFTLSVTPFAGPTGSGLALSGTF